MTKIIDYRSEGFKNYEFRPHMIGKLMVNSKAKSPKQKYEDAKKLLPELEAKYEAMNKATKTADALDLRIFKTQGIIAQLEEKRHLPHLSDGVKTELSNIFVEAMYNRRDDVESKYLTKGLKLEEDAITQYSLLTGKYYEKNTERKSNGFLTGEIDFKDEEAPMTLDTKVSWQIFQFQRSKVAPLIPLYVWQARGYMWLWNMPKARVIHALLNTPEHLIVREEKKLLYNFVGSEEDYKEACIELRKNHIYDDIPLKEKISYKDVQRDAYAEDFMRARIIECRVFLDMILNETVNTEDDEEDND